LLKRRHDVEFPVTPEFYRDTAGGGMRVTARGERPR